MEKLKEVIKIINDMDIKDRLRLGVCMTSSAYTNLLYNKSHLHSVFDKKLKEIDKDYLVSYINMRKYPVVLYTMAKIMEMNKAEQNQIYLFINNLV